MAFAYNEKETVLCFHGPLLYEAKVINRAMKDLLFTGEDQPAYFVHYKGWKQTWDEWVPESRMHKNTPENRQKQKSLKESIMKKKQPPSSTQSAGAGAQRNKPKSGGQPENSRKRGRETEEFTQESFKRPEIRLIIPDELKVLLVDDWEFVTKNNQLVPLPRTPSVKQLLISYKEHVESKTTNDAQKAKKKALVEEVTNGLEVYFNRAIASNLLYRFERPQFVQIKKEADERPDNHEHKQLSALYGTEHFLRLIVNLPSMLAFTSIDGESIEILQTTVQDILQYIIDNKSTLFLSEYENSSPQYQNRVNAGS